jgi:hypothetical protein
MRPGLSPYQGDLLHLHLPRVKIPPSLLQKLGVVRDYLIVLLTYTSH